MVRRQSDTRPQEVIKVREWVPHIGLPSKIIPLNYKLFLDIVPSSSADITRALLKGSVYVVSFRFKGKQSKSSNAVGMSSLIVWLQARVFRLRYVLTHFETLIETTWDEMGGPHKFFVLISFLSRDVFCGSAVFFFRPGFRFSVCSFGCLLFGRLFGFREFNWAKFNGDDNDFNGCVSAL